jgi:hypothetical protein
MGSKGGRGMAQPTYLPTTGTDLSQFNNTPMNQGFQWNKPQGFKDATESNIGTSNYTPNFLFQDSQFGMSGFQGQSNGNTNPATNGNVGYNGGNQAVDPNSFWKPINQYGPSMFR